MASCFLTSLYIAMLTNPCQSRTVIRRPLALVIKPSSIPTHAMRTTKSVIDACSINVRQHPQYACAASLLDTSESMNGFGGARLTYTQLPTTSSRLPSLKSGNSQTILPGTLSVAALAVILTVSIAYSHPAISS